MGNELTPEDMHKFWQLLFPLLASSLIALPLGIYLSIRLTLRHDWRKHISKGRPLKVPVLEMLSNLCITRRIKSHRWQIWEQRGWFRDRKVIYGLEAAYRDTWYWKVSITEEW